MLRVALFAAVILLLSRAVASLWGGVLEGLRGQRTAGGTKVPQRGVQMVRDPVCGTFVVPERAVTLAVGREQIHFCSARCRDAYRAHTA